MILDKLNLLKIIITKNTLSNLLQCNVLQNSKNTRESILHRQFIIKLNANT